MNVYAVGAKTLGTMGLLPDSQDPVYPMVELSILVGCLKLKGGSIRCSLKTIVNVHISPRVEYHSLVES